MMFDPMYFLFILPGLALSLWASFKTRSAFNKYSKVRAATGLTGAQAAHAHARRAPASTTSRSCATHGMLSDHYNPVTKKLALSEPVYDQPSVAAIGVACHEAGHAIQHAEKYAPLWLRSVLVPTANIGSSLGYIVMIARPASWASMKVFLIGAVLFSMVLLFQVVTLPVEFDASARAKKLAFENGIVLDRSARAWTRCSTPRR